MFNPVLKNGVTILDPNSMIAYHGDLRFENERFMLTGVPAIVSETTNIPAHYHIENDKPFNIKSIFESNDIQIIASIGDPIYRKPGQACYCDFKDIEFLYISKNFLDKIKEFNEVWWEIYGKRIPLEMVV